MFWWSHAVFRTVFPASGRACMIVSGRMASGCFRLAREILSGEILRDRARISGENMRFLGLLMVVLEAAPLFCRCADLACPHMISRGGQGGRSRERCCFCAVYRCRLPDVSGITVRFSGMPERMKTFGPPVSLRLTVCLAVDAGIIKRLNSLFSPSPEKTVACRMAAKCGGTEKKGFSVAAGYTGLRKSEKTVWTESAGTTVPARIRKERNQWKSGFANTGRTICPP